MRTGWGRGQGQQGRRRLTGDGGPQALPTAWPCVHLTDRTMAHVSRGPGKKPRHCLLLCPFDLTTAAAHGLRPALAEQEGSKPGLSPYPGPNETPPGRSELGCGLALPSACLKGKQPTVRLTPEGVPAPRGPRHTGPAASSQPPTPLQASQANWTWREEQSGRPVLGCDSCALTPRTRGLCGGPGHLVPWTRRVQSPPPTAVMTLGWEQGRR